MKDKKLIVFSAGGSGGHVFPAISLIDYFYNKYNFYFLTDSRCEYILKDKYNYQTISSSAFPKNFFDLPRAMSKIFIGTFSCLRLFREVRPSIVIGFGGYVSIPAIIAAKILRIPTVIHEQNSVLGKANRFLSLFTNFVALTYKNTKYVAKNKKIIFTGMPLRKEFYKKYNLTKSNKKRILVIGGSQGTKFFSKLMRLLVKNLTKEEIKRIFIVQQVIEEDKKEVENFYLEKKMNFRIETFFSEIFKELYNADLVISRCGASTLEEISIFNKTSILFPLPNSAENHQLLNALQFKKKNRSIIFLENNFEINHFLKVVKSVIVKEQTQKEPAKRHNTGLSMLIDSILEN